MTQDKQLAAMVFGALVSLGGCALVLGVDTHDVGASDGGGSGSGGSDAGPACTSSKMCAATPATPACDMANDTCVQCLPGETTACTGISPVCGDDHGCRACGGPAECTASGVCQADGSCADADAVAYVAPNGGPGGCAQASPCGTIAQALLTGKAIIKVAGGGSVKDAAPTTIASSVAIYGDPGATLDRVDDGPLLTITGGTVSLVDLELTGGGGTTGTALLVSGPAVVSLEHVTVTKNTGYGIYTDTTAGAQIHVADSEISSNDLGGIVANVSSQIHVAHSNVSKNNGLGISVPHGTLEVTQSTIAANIAGGIAVSGAFTITNDYIVTNGLATDAGNFDASLVGGASLNASSAEQPSCRFEFNTVADNVSKLTAGVVCSVSSTFQLANNIVSHNTSAGNTTTNTSGICVFAATNVIAADNALLAFTNAGAGDYRIGATSSARDFGTTTSPVAVDNEGTSRPQGPQKDAGANEFLTQ